MRLGLPFLCRAVIIERIDTGRAPVRPGAVRRMPPTLMRTLRSPALAYAGLIVACMLVVSPIAEFPLNDDWLYAKMAQNTLDAGAYVAHPFVAANATLHTIWGAAVIAVCGFSYTALRVSTLLFTFLTAWFASRAAQEAGAGRRTAFLAGLVILVNPVVINLSYTFMTDIMFLAMLTVATWGYVRAFRTGHARDLAIGSTFSVCAMLIRQMGVLHPAVFVIAWTMVFARRKTWPSLKQVGAFAVPLILGAVVYEWAKQTSGGIYTWPNAWERAPVSIIVLQIGRYVFASCIYFGLFLLPFAIAYGLWLTRRPSAWTWMRTYWAGMILIWLTMFGCGFMLMPRAAPMPLLTNIIRNFGVGPLTLHDTTHLYPGWGPVQFGAMFWWTVTALSMLSATVLAVELFARFVRPALWKTATGRRAGSHVRHAQYLFLVGLAAAHLLALQNPWVTVLFDRYLLPSLMPLAILSAVLLTRINAQRTVTVALAVCLACLAFSLVSLQDYFAWNRARWEAVEILRTEYGATNQQIEGGYEFNGAFTSDAYMEVNDSTDFLDTGLYAWWTFDPEYAITFLPREGFTWERDVPYFSWLGMEERHVVILKRIRPGAPE